MSLKGWLQPGYRLLVMFFATTLALVAALAWMSWELVRQEGALAGQRVAGVQAALTGSKDAVSARPYCRSPFLLFAQQEGDGQLHSG